MFVQSYYFLFSVALLIVFHANFFVFRIARFVIFNYFLVIHYFLPTYILVGVIGYVCCVCGITLYINRIFVLFSRRKHFLPLQIASWIFGSHRDGEWLFRYDRQRNVKTLPSTRSVNNLVGPVVDGIWFGIGHNFQVSIGRIFFHAVNYK